MPRRCSFNGCKSVLENNKKCTLFKAPKGISILTAWNEALSKANGKSFIASFICHKHFLAKDMISVYVECPENLKVSY